MSGGERGRQLLYLVIDGLGDVPCPALGGRTPLEAARLPQLDALARDGEAYLLDMRDSDGFVSTARGQFALCGYDADDELPRRGAVEAAGLDLPLQNGDVAFRANWATFDSAGRIVDRRAGRIRQGATELAALLDGWDLGDGISAVVRCGIEHRVALVLRGPGLGADVSDSDPLSTAALPIPPLEVAPRRPSDAAAALTAAKLTQFLSRARAALADHPVNLARRARGLLPANGLLTRRAGRHVEVQSLQARFGLRCQVITGDRTVNGVMRLLGCEVLSPEGFTANVDTDLPGKFNAAVAGLAAGIDIVMLHIKGVDILSHDRQPAGSVELLERIDALLGEVRPRLPAEVLIAVAADHSTSSVTGDHIVDPPPALLYGRGAGGSGAAAFSERALAGAPILRRGAFFRLIKEALGR